jgi:L-seryl-tRNA(Ser) seleniumtransferase
LKSTSAQCRQIDPGDGQSPPILEITVNERQLGRSAFEVCRRLRQGAPPIYVGHGKLSEGVLVIRPACLQNSQIEPLIGRLIFELS